VSNCLNLIFVCACASSPHAAPTASTSTHIVHKNRWRAVLDSRSRIRRPDSQKEEPFKKCCGESCRGCEESIETRQRCGFIALDNVQKVGRRRRLEEEESEDEPRGPCGRLSWRRWLKRQRVSGKVIKKEVHSGHQGKRESCRRVVERTRCRQASDQQRARAVKEKHPAQSSNERGSSRACGRQPSRRLPARHCAG